MATLDSHFFVKVRNLINPLPPLKANVINEGDLSRYGNINTSTNISTNKRFETQIITNEFHWFACLT